MAVANVNGKISKLEDAKIGVDDRGFLYGDSLYEVKRLKILNQQKKQIFYNLLQRFRKRYLYYF